MASGEPIALTVCDRVNSGITKTCKVQPLDNAKQQETLYSVEKLRIKRPIRIEIKHIEWLCGHRARPSGTITYQSKAVNVSISITLADKR